MGLCAKLRAQHGPARPSTPTGIPARKYHYCLRCARRRARRALSALSASIRPTAPRPDQPHLPLSPRRAPARPAASLARGACLPRWRRWEAVGGAGQGLAGAVLHSRLYGIAESAFARQPKGSASPRNHRASRRPASPARATRCRAEPVRPEHRTPDQAHRRHRSGAARCCASVCDQLGPPPRSEDVNKCKQYQ